MTNDTYKLNLTSARKAMGVAVRAAEQSIMMVVMGGMVLALCLLMLGLLAYPEVRVETLTPEWWTLMGGMALMLGSYILAAIVTIGHIRSVAKRIEEEMENE